MNQKARANRPPPVRANTSDQQTRSAGPHSMVKSPEPCFCPNCGTLFHPGRWQWGKRHPDPADVICPACNHGDAGLPAGFLQVSGPFFAEHRSEVLCLLGQQAEKYRKQQPQSHIVSIEEDEHAHNTMLLTTSDIDLARTLGEALHHQYGGELDFRHCESEKVLRVRWQRQSADRDGIDPAREDPPINMRR